MDSGIYDLIFRGLPIPMIFIKIWNSKIFWLAENNAKEARCQYAYDINVILLIYTNEEHSLYKFSPDG